MSKPKSAIPKVLTTQTAVADFFGVTAQTVKLWSRNWKKESECPCTQRHYDLLWIARWNLNRQQLPVKVRKVCCEVLGLPFEEPKEGDQPTPGTKQLATREDLLRAQVRSEVAKAEGLERKNRIAEANLVELDDVRQLFASYNTYVRVQFKQMVSKLDPKYRKEVDQQVDIVLRACYDFRVQVDELQTEDKR